MTLLRHLNVAVLIPQVTKPVPQGVMIDSPTRECSWVTGEGFITYAAYDGPTEAFDIFSYIRLDRDNTWCGFLRLVQPFPGLHLISVPKAVLLDKPLTHCDTRLAPLTTLCPLIWGRRKLFPPPVSLQRRIFSWGIRPPYEKNLRNSNLQGNYTSWPEHPLGKLTELIPQNAPTTTQDRSSCSGRCSRGDQAQDR